jgi:hypothetical protein
MVLHAASCELVNYRCAFCDMCVEKKNKKQHDLLHEFTECECGLRIMKCKLPAHQENRCASRSLCPYCNREHRIRGLFAHFQECAARLTMCMVCGDDEVTIGDIVHGRHAKVCAKPCICGKRVAPADRKHHKQFECPMRMSECRYCGKDMRLDLVPAHEASCPLNRRNDNKDNKTISSPGSSNNNNNNVDPSKLAMLTGMGYGKEQATSALIQTNGNLDRAVAILLG